MKAFNKELIQFSRSIEKTKEMIIWKLILICIKKTKNIIKYIYIFKVKT
jgi:hypothetical protein